MWAVGTSVQTQLWLEDHRSAILVTFGPPPLEFCWLIFSPSLTERHTHMVLPQPDADCTRKPAYCAAWSPSGLAQLREPQPALGTLGEETCSSKAAAWQTLQHATTPGISPQASLPDPCSLRNTRGSRLLSGSTVPLL